MPYQATVLRVMIASPGDVQGERDAIHEIIHEWNVINATDRQVVLLPVAWETHSSPEMGNRPQEFINKQVLEDCDILIAVFWTRLGTPTGVYPSGTVEEIRGHVSKGKPAMIYFSSRPIAPNKLDSEQFEKVKKFKEECRSEGLTQEYGSLEEFRATVSRQLAIKLWNSKVPQVRELAQTSTHAEVLSMEATRPLVAGTHDRSGAIVKTQTLGGLHVRTNGQDFIQRPDPREAAKWIAAIQSLANEGLIEDRTGKGEVFFITSGGYELANFVSENMADLRPPQKESEVNRKVRRILEMKASPITLRQMWPESHRAINGAVRGQSDAIVRNCDDHVVHLEILGSGTNKSLPLSRVTIAHDDERQRPALEWLP